jgi:hypothetical protein
VNALRRALDGPLSARPAVAALALAGLVGGVLMGSPGLELVQGCGAADDLYPSQTAADWTGNADHVVVATPTAERETGREEYDEGTFRYRMDRTITFRADDVLWSSARPRRPMGAEFETTGAGWKVYRKSGDRLETLSPEAPRLETGHTYLLALRWDGGRWAVLGEGAAVPFDDHVAGRGEWCGRVLSTGDVALGEHFSRKSDHSLEKAVLGQGEEAVVGALRSAGKGSG